MAIYSGTRRSATPSTSNDNWTITAGANENARVKAFHWGGEATATTAMATRVARSSGQTGASTVLLSAANIERSDPGANNPGCGLISTFATTQPTLNTGDLFMESWNCHGGLMYWHAGSPDEEFFLIGAATELCISCRNSVGTGTSSYGVSWGEA